MCRVPNVLITAPEVPLDTTIPLPTITPLCSLDGELPLGEVRLALLGLLQNPRGVLGGQAAADGASLLGPEVKGQVLLVLVEEAELSTLLRVDDGEDAGDRLADIVDLGELAARGDDLLDAKLAQLRLELTQLLGELVLVLGPQLARLDLGSRLLT
jgi:hypothetical protein